MAGELVFVENTNGGDLSVISVPGYEVTRSIPVGEHPDDVIASADGNLLFVNRQGPRDLVAVDVSSGEIVWTVQLSGIPHHLGLTTDGRQVYVALFNELRDEVIDVSTREIVARPFTGFGAHGVHVASSGERVYVGSMVHDHLAVLDPKTWKTISLIPMPEGVRPFDLTNDSKRMYVQLSKRHGFVVVDLEKEAIVEEVDLPPVPPDVEWPVHFPHTVNHGLKLTPDNRYVFAAGSVAGYVCVYTVPDHDLVATIDVGAEPNWIVWSTDASHAYVSNRAEDTVSVLSVDELREVKRITVGKYPQRMAVVTTA